jgi:predicted small lipoprotein YifL
MKNQTLILIILIILSVGLVSCGKKDPKEKSYPEHLKSALDKAGDISTDYQINHIKEALNSYYIDNGEYPANLDELVPSYLKVDLELMDPYDTKFKIENNEIISAGKDKRFGTGDDKKWEI